MSSNIFYPMLEEQCFPIKEFGNKVKNQELLNTSGQIECPHCHKKSRSKYVLDQHLKIVHGKEKLFQCNICLEKFGRKYSLKKHCNTVHNYSKTVNCPMCHYKFTVSSELRRHIKFVHENFKPYSCEKCDRKCRSNFDLKRHVNLVHEKKKSFQCSLCLMQYGDNFSFKRHLSKVHKIVTNKISEGQNGHTSLDLSLLKPISKSILPNVTLSCDWCSFLPENENDLYHHCQTVHKTDKPHKCSICSFRFQSELDLMEHELSQCLQTRLQFLREQSVRALKIHL